MHHLKHGREGFAFRGRFEAFRVRQDLERDRDGRIVTAPSCWGLEHRRGVCPHGHRHDVRRVADKNQVVDGWYDAILANARGEGTPSLDITHIAGGTGAAARTAVMTALGNETWREEWTDRQEASDTESVFYWYVSEAVPTQFFHEWGAFAGGATSTLGSGLLVASWLLDDDHDSASSLNAQWTLSKA